MLNFLNCSGMKFEKLSSKQADIFQLNILKTILQLEATYFELAEEDTKNVLVVCDRGTMDPSACQCLGRGWKTYLVSVQWLIMALRYQGCFVVG